MGEIKLIKDNEPISSSLSAMEVGERIAFAASRMSSVKTLCSNLGFETDRTYTTRINRENRTIEVSRTR